MAGGLLGRDSDQESNEEVMVRQGSIVRVTMHNFITYDSVVCTPGPSLNVVIGPNGTGKSTILSAIVLGLGGKPSLLGKPQTGIQEFIKNDRREAQIEIELLQVGKANTVVKRIITREGKSTWFLNGRPVSATKIEAETRSLNIQIDNLCQVLPQDRVQDFAKLNKQELLEATQKAVGKEGMSEIHTKLKDLQRNQKQLEIQIETEKKRRETEQGQVDRLKGAVEKMEKRKGMEEEAEACKLKLSFVKYQQKNEEVKQCRVLVRECETKVKNFEAQIRPYEQQITQAEENYNGVKNRSAGMERRINAQVKTVSELRDSLENHREEILTLELNMETQIKSSETQGHKEEEIRQAISKLKNDIACQASIPAEQIVAQVRKMKQDVERLAVQLNQCENQKLQIDSEIHEVMGEMTQVNRNVERMANLKDKRLNHLHGVHPGAYQASRWIESNRDKFEAPVYLPMIVELDVNPQFSKYVEATIGYQDLVAITCESKNDMKLIIEKCRTQMKINVNVLHVSPRNDPFEPQISLDELRRRFGGFEGFLKDFVNGPKTLLDFLCYRKNFHNIPVARTDVEASETLSLYYSADYRKGHTRSRFSSALMYTSDPIGEGRFFLAQTNDGDLDALRDRANELQNQLDLKKKQQAAKQKDISDIRAQREKLRNEQQKLSKTQTSLETLRFHLSRKEKDLANMEKHRVDPEKVKAECRAKARTAVLKLAMAQEPFYQALKSLDSLVIESQLLEFDVQAAKIAVNQTKRLCKAEQEALDDAKRELEVLRNRLSDFRTEATRQSRAIEQKNGGRKLLQIWEDPSNQALFSTLPDSPEELETQIEDKLAHANLLGGPNDANVVRDFELHLRQLEALKASIESKELQAENLVADMEKRKNEWKAELEALVKAITKNFERYFREMGCAGEVLLHTGNSEHDYDNYGLRIRVKFRPNEGLQDLNAHTQSGGERAVSTAIYMLSLQELTPAPFRLVDEINQGMDSINERKVYDLLMRSTSRPGTPQYFLLTPKLLKDMEYSVGTTVLCVMNSPCAPSHKTWDINKFIALRRQQDVNGVVNGITRMDVEDDDDD